MTRNRVQISLMPDLEQTEAQSPGYVADLEPASLRERVREKLQGQVAEERGQTCLKHENGKSKRLHRGRPADSEVPSQVGKDGRIQQKDRARQQAKRKEKTDPHSAD